MCAFLENMPSTWRCVAACSMNTQRSVHPQPMPWRACGMLTDCSLHIIRPQCHEELIS